jgi:GGDEF domain-containing protein
MGLFKSFSSSGASIKLATLPAVPTTEDLLFVLATATQNKRSAELPFKNPHNNVTFNIKVAPATIQHAPRWTFTRCSDNGDVVLWARESNEVMMIQGKVKIECNYSGVVADVVTMDEAQSTSAQEFTEQEPKWHEGLESTWQEGQESTPHEGQQSPWQEGLEPGEAAPYAAEPHAAWQNTPEHEAAWPKAAEPDEAWQKAPESDPAWQKDARQEVGREDLAREDRTASDLPAPDVSLQKAEAQAATSDQATGKKGKSKKAKARAAAAQAKAAQASAEPQHDRYQAPVTLPPPVILHPEVLNNYLSSLSDPATGLLYHGAFEFFLLRDVEYVQKHGVKMSLLVFDFANPQSQEPANISTEAAAIVAKIMSESCTPLELCTQLRTGEFAILLCGYDGESALNFAEKLCAKLPQGKNELSILANLKLLAMGVACIPEHCADPASLISAAIQAKLLARESKLSYMLFG